VKFLEIGKIVKTHGLKGHLKAVSYLAGTTVPDGVTELFIELAPEGRRRFGVHGLRAGRRELLLNLEGVTSIEQAAALVGGRIFVSRDQWEQLSEDEYFWEDLLGMTVVTEDGRVLGTISNIFATGSTDVYVCRRDEREILLPAIADVVRSVDTEGGTMVVRLLEGLVHGS
jgi:16S rRNA processing protein RimM